MERKGSKRSGWRRWLGSLFQGRTPRHPQESIPRPVWNSRDSRDSPPGGLRQPGQPAGRSPIAESPAGGRRQSGDYSYSGGGSLRAGPSYKTYTFDELRAATNDFSGVKLGEGGYGVVYKGTINQQEVAVKKIRLDPSNMKNVEAEIQVMGLVKHINVMEMLGLCYGEAELYIVSECMQNGDLEDQLGGLSWEQRFTIAREIAAGLDYLHHTAGREMIIHRDIKGKNILLDRDFRARIADFGITRIVNPARGPHCTEKLGTRGFAPIDLDVTDKWDVFSFGVVLLQLLSGQLAAVNNPGWTNFLYHRALMNCRSSIQFLQFLDPRCPVREMAHLVNARRVFRVALQCLQGRYEHRPDMKEVKAYLADLRFEREKQVPLPPIQSWMPLPGDVNPLEFDEPALLNEMRALVSAIHDDSSWETLAVLSTQCETPSKDVKLAMKTLVDKETERKENLYFCVKTTNSSLASERGGACHKKVSKKYHRNLVYYLGRKLLKGEEGMLQFCMEYVGESLKSRIDGRGPLEEQDAVRYTRDLLKGLRHVHNCGVIHLGVKCENMLIMDGTADVVKLGGFGSAILDKTHKSNANAAPGMMAWMPDGYFEPRAAPEVSLGAAHIDWTADIWSVGIAVHEMLTGRVPFVNQVKHKPPEDTLFIQRPQIETTTLSPAAQNFVRRCLRKENNESPTIEALFKDPFLATK